MNNLILAALALMAQDHRTNISRIELKARRGARKNGGGNGGAGVTLRKFAPTRQPIGYYAQATAPNHIHPRSKR